jgi:hypothetical protein
MSPADLIAIGSSGVGVSVGGVLRVSSSLVAATKKPAPPPSEADTESTLHSDFDHCDHTTDVDQMTEAGNLSSCGCCSSSVSSHEPESEPGDEPEEPDEPDEPDLSPEDMMRLLMEDVSTLPAYSATTQSDADVDVDVNVDAVVGAGVTHRHQGQDQDQAESDSESASTADSGASVTPTDSPGKVDTPAPGTFTKIKEIVSTAVMDDEDVRVRVSAAKNRGRSLGKTPVVRDSALVVSPLAAKVARNSSPHGKSRATSPSSPRSSSPADNAWSHVLW